MNIIEELINKIRLMVGRCVITACSYDSNDLKVDVELLAGEKRRKLDFLQQYGLISRPVGDVSGLALFVGGKRANGVVVACNAEEKKMKKELEPGEVCLLSPHGQQIFLKKDGSVSIVSGNGKIEMDGKLIVSEGVEIGGGLRVKESIAADGAVSSGLDVIAFKDKPNKVGLSTHIHLTPAGNSSPPTPGM
jgi:phage baseplate assembly protein V